MRYVLAWLLFLSINSYSQVSEFQFFTDSSAGFIDRIQDFSELEDGIVLSGYQRKGWVHESPIILKLDTQGEVIWSTFNQIKYYPRHCHSFKLASFNEEIYGSSVEGGWGGDTARIWKVNINSGKIDWTISLPHSANSKTELFDVNPAVVGIRFFSTITPDLYFINKENGTVISKHKLNLFGNFFDVVSDKNENIFVTNGIEIVKYNLDHFGHEIWRKDYNDVSDERRVESMYIDRYGELYCFGESRVFKIDANTGELIWDRWFGQMTNMHNLTMTQFIEDNDQLIVDFVSTLTGNGNSKMRIVKVDKLSGNLEWFSYGNLTTDANAVHQIARSIDIDCSKQIYVTGSYNYDGHHYGNWGIARIDTDNGEVIKNYHVEPEGNHSNESNYGIASCVINETPMFLGHLEYKEDLALGAFAKIDVDSDEISLKKHIAGGVKFESGTQKLISSENYITALKQVGPCLYVERYDSSENLKWSHKLCEPTPVVNGRLATGDSVICLLSEVLKEETYAPYYSNETFQLRLTCLDAYTGELVSEDSIHSQENKMVPLELEIIDQIPFFTYSINDSIVLGKIDQDSLSILGSFYNNIANSKLEPNYITPIDSTTLAFVNMNHIFKIYRDSSVIDTLLYELDPGHYSEILVIDTTVFVAGSSASGNQIVTSSNIETKEINWTREFSENGSIFHLELDSFENLYCAGVSSNKLELLKISTIDGDVLWNFVLENEEPLDLLLNEELKCIAIAGYRKVMNDTSSSDVSIQLVDLDGHHLYSHYDMDEMEDKSVARTLCKIPDGKMWVGGSWNTLKISNQGFIYHLDNDSASIEVGINEKFVSKTSNILAYPNPASDIVYLSGFNHRYSSCRVFDSAGRLIHSELSNLENGVVFSEFEPGVYVVVIENELERHQIRVIKQ